MTVKELKEQLEQLDENATIAVSFKYREPGDWKAKDCDIYNLHVINTLMGAFIVPTEPKAVKEVDFKDWK